MSESPVLGMKNFPTTIENIDNPNNNISLNDLIGRFPDGFNRFNNSELFHKVIMSMLNGLTCYQAIDMLLKHSEIQQEELTKILNNYPPNRIIILNNK